jgi:hypothetical protein
MNRLVFSIALILGVCVWIGASSPTPTPSFSPSPFSSPVSSPVNRNILLREFLRSQKSELKSLEHQHKFDLKELKASQEAREKEWRKKEDDARHKFFETHSEGSARRAYVQDFILRRDALKKYFNDERAQRKQEQDVRISAIRQDQGLRLKDFKQALEKGVSPSAVLWPTPGR